MDGSSRDVTAMVGSVKNRLPTCSRESGVHTWDTASAPLQDFGWSVALHRNTQPHQVQVPYHAVKVVITIPRAIIK